MKFPLGNKRYNVYPIKVDVAYVEIKILLNRHINYRPTLSVRT